jgi:hypothetical protein
MKHNTTQESINSTDVFNQWIIFSNDRYELIDTIDIEIEIPKDVWHDKKHAPLNEFIKNNKLGNFVLEHIKTHNLNKQYDAFTIIHVMNYGDDKLTVGLDCFKKSEVKNDI